MDVNLAETIALTTNCSSLPAPLAEGERSGLRSDPPPLGRGEVRFV